MKDDYLVFESLSGLHLETERALLDQHEIKTHTALFAVLRDHQSDAALRTTVCSVIWMLGEHIDRRRAVPALLKALQAPQVDIRIAAARALGMLEARRAHEPLLAIACDKQEHKQLRLTALNFSYVMHGEQARSAMHHLIFDETDDLEVRAMALEWSQPLSMEDYVALLSHPTSDLRFWSAFRLADMRYDESLLMALDALDRTAAFDHTLPQYWGWHVDREALKALEHIRFRLRWQRWNDQPKTITDQRWQTWLISAALEYDDFVLAYQGWRHQGWHDTSPFQEVPKLHLSPHWLKQQLENHWSQVSFEPITQVLQIYTLQWELEIEGDKLIGGLHRDGYSLVLTTEDDRLAQTFAVWFRGLIPQEQPLWLYEWASPGVMITPTITREEIEQQLLTKLDAFNVKVREQAQKISEM